MTLEGKRVLITGAARRIGRQLALAIAQAGGQVIVHYGHSLAEAESLRNEITSLGGGCQLLQADLDDPAQVQGLIPHAMEYGPVYALVNNASLFEMLDLESTTRQSWEHHLRVNLTAPFLLCQAFARQVPPEGAGRIVNMLDWRALRPGADHLPYTISKSALAALTQALAVALAPRITVNGLALGAVLPPSEGPIPEKLLARVPAGRWANLEEVSQALMFLLDGPAYVTGEIIHLDGGRHLN